LPVASKLEDLTEDARRHDRDRIDEHVRVVELTLNGEGDADDAFAFAADEKAAKAGKTGTGKKAAEPPPGTSAGKRRVVQDLPMPQPKGQKDSDVVGYGEKERRDMQRLHDSIKDR